MSTIRVLIADDHAILRLGLRSLLETYPDIQVVGEAADGQEAVEQVRLLQPDVVLLDVAMPRMNGLTAARRILEENPEVRIVVLTQYENPEYIKPLLQAGVAAYILKQSADVDLITAIRSVHRGDSFLHPRVAKVLVDAYTSGESGDPYDRLTPREREVLILVAQGLSNRAIGEILQISPKTVDVHRTRMMEKLNLHNVAQVTRYAIRRGLLDPNAD